MHTAARLGLFAAGAAAVFTVALVAAPLVIPADASAAWTSTEEDHDMDSAETGTDAHGGAAASGTAYGAADDVRGLSVSHRGYTLTALDAPTTAGEAGAIAFTITDAEGDPLTEYDTAHDKDLHLIVVRTDGAHFRHVHPEIDGSGTWTVPFTFGAAGTYRVFTDFVPTEHGETITLTSTVEVAGAFTPEPRTVDAMSATVDGITVELTGGLAAGAERELTFTVTRGVTRPVWEPDAGTMALYEKARGIAKGLGMELPHGSAGGGSDGNFTGAMGIPTLDGLGVRGGGIHTLEEHIEVESLVERGRLMAGLLATLD